METFKAIGIMSGTSLDGLDLAYSVFTLDQGRWSFELLHAVTIPYPKDLTTRLSAATQLSGLELTKLDMELGQYIGNKAAAFIADHNLTPDLIGSHGHTIFHQPAIGLTHQIGDGNYIHAKTNVPVIFDFRSLDVARGGDGAPLVPIGDQLLFSKYDGCLNLGGIANISFNDQAGSRIAFDIVPVNMVLNHLARQLGQDYDEDGAISRNGTLNQELLQQWNALKYYSAPHPKSLGYEWFEKYLLPTFKGINQPDLMHSYCTHAAQQINIAIKENLTIDQAEILVTGGGAYNDFFMECLKGISGDRIKWIKPSREIIEFKEALIFGFLGVLRIKNQVNVLRTATGATQDSVGGILLGDPLNMR